jgi:hypothetical protein
MSQVVFIHDYIELVFQETRWSLYNPVTVHCSGCTLTESDLGFADALRCLIGQRVVETSAEQGQFASATFEGLTQVFVSLRSEDARGPEAYELGNDKGLSVVEQNE